MRPSTPVGGGVQLIPHGVALQYKLADNGCFFSRELEVGFCKAEMLSLILQLLSYSFHGL